ncbi:hypothetical protein [Phenylobacterium montanum]|uniref:Bulb-type lectin domain-containing protein n=1 Tax=Phenylobacterium montanum TaxID=2823693 RepID=A0A975G265_9CAUL|nr:hypothetical protein [Caulobacter sp. S6]QUD89229.1 hypothetical protein KCG34_04935 [Caulobacter sp. S6]
MRRSILSLGVLFASCAGLAAAAAPVLPALAPAFDKPGDILISDQFNNRVIEVDAARGAIVWHWGVGPNDLSANSAIGVNDALRVGDFTLISGTGAPPGTEPGCPSGCADNRVFFVDHAGRIVWQYGTFGVTGAGWNQLNTPVQATWTAQRTVLIADQGNQRVIEVNLAHHVIWQYGHTGEAGNGPNHLNNPNSIEELANGDLLIADESNNRAIEVNRAHVIVRTFTAGGTLNGVAFASRLPDGDTLITDANNNRIVEVNAHDQIVWSYVTNTQPGSNANPNPTRAVRLRNGNTLISDQNNHRVILVNHAGTILNQYGNLNSPGFGLYWTRQGLNAPYDAKVIGDNTGLTWFPNMDLH